MLSPRRGRLLTIGRAAIEGASLMGLSLLLVASLLVMLGLKTHPAATNGAHALTAGCARILFSYALALLGVVIFALASKLTYRFASESAIGAGDHQ